ncbi:MAG TPA: DUF459 domain-containing protein [Chloroflexota bacterium]|nr:DUF459 domain-containing protein [Chloroflexota bacterium]
MSLTQVDTPRETFRELPTIVDLGSVRQTYPATRTRVRTRRARRERTDSPVASVRQVLKACAVTILVVVLLGARGIIQTARGMAPSPIQSITLSIGNMSLGVEQFCHLTWPWDDLQAALGHHQQFGVPPLLRVTPTTKPPAPHQGTSGGTGPHVTKPSGSGKHGGKGGHQNAPKPQHHVQWPAIRQITKAHPLNLLITGDSLVGYMGPQILNLASSQGPVTGATDTHDGTGLTTPAFVDWSLLAGQQVHQFHPDAIVIMIGGNDFENMTLPSNKFFPAGTKSWTREYQRRAAYVMRTWIRGGVKRVYWLSMPLAQNASWANDDRHIDVALRRAAALVPGVHYVNVLGPILNHGHYAAYVKYQGVPTLIREPDGVHLNIAGSQIVTNEVVPIIKREWHFGWSQVKRRNHHHGPGRGLRVSPRRRRTV